LLCVKTQQLTDLLLLLSAETPSGEKEIANFVLKRFLATTLEDILI